jgi:hypothetical protein
LLQFKNICISVKTLSMLSFPNFLWQPHNQIANVDFLLILEAFGGLHRARCWWIAVCSDLCEVCLVDDVFF